MKPSSWIKPFIVVLTILRNAPNVCAAICMSQEQFLASIPSRYPEVLIFIADVLQVIPGYRAVSQSTFLHSDNHQQQTAYVRIVRIVNQPMIGWQVAPGNVAYIKEIQARPMDNAKCLPTLVHGRSFLWVTQNNAGTKGSLADDALRLVPGGLFPVEGTPTGDRSNDVCSQVACHHGAVCQAWTPDKAGSPIGVCVCPGLELLKSEGQCDPQPIPLCADNGQVYETECAMQLAACLQQTALKRVNIPPFVSRVNLKIKCRQAAAVSQVTSDRGVPSKADGILKQTEQDRPQQDAYYVQNPAHKPVQHQCELLVPCSTVAAPVCGSDLVIYQNKCLLEQSMCTSNGERLVETSMDICLQSSGIPDVRRALCAGNNLCLFGAECVVASSRSYGTVTMHQSGFLQCSCEKLSCVNEWPDPVCADDGNTYSNECTLRRAACEQQTALGMLYRGNCAANPCRGHTCRWAGERCQIDRNGQAKCVCPPRCPNVVTPVCGNDGVTFESHCHMERAACLKMRDIWVIHSGQCSDRELCKKLGIPCKTYEICSQSPATSLQYGHAAHESSSSATCTCPQCPHRGLGDQVCGSDGQTYRSECHLRASACVRRQADLVVLSRGYCDACKTKQCKFHSVCQLNRFSEPECICPTECLHRYAPVCGTDDKMYENECFLKVKACSERRNIQIANEGTCRTCIPACQLGSQCRGGICVCREACPKPGLFAIEICGTDGQLYPSECELRRTACSHQNRVDVDPSGAACRNRKDRPTDDRADLQADVADTSKECSCNKVGALSEYCDYLGKCRCKWGVEGEKCDKCIPGYWGIQNGHDCISCSCHPDGSTDQTCHQLTGQCQCRPGTVGRQCSICPKAGQQLTAEGCQSVHTGDKLSEAEDQLQPRHKNHISKATTKDEATRQDTISPTPGRYFTSQTTLFVRVPFTLVQPFTIQLGLILMSDPSSGAVLALLHHNVAPSRQESLLLTNPEGQQISLSIVARHVIFHYADRRQKGLMTAVKSPQTLDHHGTYTIKFGVTNNMPWLQVDEGSNVTTAKTGSVTGSTSAGRSRVPVAPTENHGTFMIGKPRSSGGSRSVPGFEGCLFQLVVESADRSRPAEIQHKQIDLVKLDWNDLAWLGVARRPSGGPPEAHLCDSTSLIDSKHQSDSSSESPRREADEVLGQLSCQTDTECHNNGACVVTPSTGRRECLCQPGWQGRQCGQEVSIIPQFDGTSYIRLVGPSGQQAMRRRQLHVELVFWARHPSGLLFYIPPRNPGNGASVDSGPFLAIYLDSLSHVVVIARVGSPTVISNNHRPSGSSTVAMLRYKEPSTLNQWHTLTVNKKVRQMELQVNGGAIERMKLVPPDFANQPRHIRKSLTAFDLSNSPVYIGGYPFNSYPSPHLTVTLGLNGAFQKVNINGADVILAGPQQPTSMTSPLSAPSTQVSPPLDHSEATTEQWLHISQWQGPPCGPGYTPCLQDQANQICRPQKWAASCACSTPVQLWQLIREQQDGVNIEQAENRACTRRQTELEQARLSRGSGKEHLENLGVGAIQHDQMPVAQPNEYPQPPSPPTTTVAPTPVPTRIQPRESKNSQSCGRWPIRFEGKTVFKIKGIPKSDEDYSVRFRMKTATSDGLIMSLLTTETNSKQPTPLTLLTMRKGVVEFRILKRYSNWPARQTTSSLGSLILLRSKFQITDGRCHMVQVIVRNSQRASLIIDHQMTSDNFREQNVIPGRSTMMHFGGTTSELTDYPWEYQRNFTGCISDVFVNEQAIPLLTASFEIRGPLIPCS